VNRLTLCERMLKTISGEAAGRLTVYDIIHSVDLIEQVITERKVEKQ